MRFLVIISLAFILFACKSTKEHCDAYSQNEIKNSNVLISRIQMEDGLFKKVKNNLVFY